MRQLSLCDLPKELLFHTFTFFDGKTLIASCCSVCRLWKDVIDGSAELQYSIELWADGMVAGPSRFGSTIPAVERLRALSAHRSGWRTLNWTSHAVIPIASSARAYDLVHGVFAQQDAGLFTATWLQSIPDEETRTTSSRDLGIEPQDFTMDPTQDLVVFVYERAGEAMIECRSLTSLQAHPLAALPILSFPVEEPLQYLAIEIAGDVISVFGIRFGRIVLFNWRRGTMIMDIHAGRGRHRSTFTLLSPRAYILGCITGSGAIEIWEFEDGENKVPTHMATLQLPALAEDWMAGYVGAHGASFRAYPTANKLFSQSNESRLYVILLQYDYLEIFNEMRFCLFVHHRYLESYLSQGGGPRTVPWEEWGPRHSRIIDGMVDHKWIRYVSGERVVLPPGRGQQGPRTLEVLDFSLNATRSPSVATEPAVSSQFTSELCAKPTTIRDVLNMFKSAVTTTLPYRRTFRGFDEDHSSFMIDENHLIGANDTV
ncbi:hypothetical protein B0H11DRAFT_2286734 [Mycena galericulata]|nr:hypothetical protein B0H11DRAFT_2286734 [Mycena galericulata]